MALRNQLEELKTWANYSNILFLESNRIYPKENPHVEFGEDLNSINVFQETAIQLSPKIIFYNTSKIDFTKLDYFENEIYLKEANHLTKKRFESTMEKIIKLRNSSKNDDYLHFTLFMVHDGVIYTASKLSEILSEYNRIESNIDAVISIRRNND